MMTDLDLVAALKSIGWSRAELARRVLVHPNTVTKWTRGHAPVPGAVEAYVRLVQAVRAAGA